MINELNSKGIFIIYPDTFRINKFTEHPFRMIGIIEVGIMYSDRIEKVAIPYFRSSGTNSGKIQGLWYPIVGIKLFSGEFEEFSSYINLVLTRTTKYGAASRGWLAKSIFFYKLNLKEEDIKGFSSGIYYEGLLRLGKTLRKLYEDEKYKVDSELTPIKLNDIIYSNNIYEGNKESQRKNFDLFIEDVYNGQNN